MVPEAPGGSGLGRLPPGGTMDRELMVILASGLMCLGMIPLLWYLVKGLDRGDHEVRLPEYVSAMQNSP